MYPTYVRAWQCEEWVGWTKTQSKTRMALRPPQLQQHAPPNSSRVCGPAIPAAAEIFQETTTTTPRQYAYSSDVFQMKIHKECFRHPHFTRTRQPWCHPTEVGQAGGNNSRCRLEPEHVYKPSYVGICGRKISALSIVSVDNPDIPASTKFTWLELDDLLLRCHTIVRVL